MNNETRQMIEYSYLINRGILLLNELDDSGEKANIVYDFNCKEYKEIKEKYDFEKIAGKGSEFIRAKRLLANLSSRLTHFSMYDNHISQNALDLLAYSLDNPKQGINCLNKSKIFVEVCLALGIKARRVVIMPYSPYDSDNHVVAEIYDTKMKKWIMMDPTSGGFFVSKDNLPLSIVEMREHFANNKFITHITPSNRPNLESIERKNLEDNWYICKNVFRFSIESYQGFGLPKNTASFDFCPKNFSINDWYIKNNEYRIEFFADESPEFVEQSKKNIELLKKGEEPKHYSVSSIY